MAAANASVAPISSFEASAVEVHRQTSLRYFPFAYTQTQVDPIKCDEAASLVMVELPFSVFQCMARSFNDVLMLDDRIRIVRLFFFVLQMACDSGLTVALETVVNGVEFVGVDGEKLNDDTVVLAYRLWIPLDSASEVSFLTAVSGALNTAATDVGAYQTAGGLSGTASAATNSKRRRIDATVEAYNNLPTYLWRVKTVAELSQLIRLYYMGQANVEVALIAEEDHSGGHPDATGSVSRMVMSQLLDAAHQFAHPTFMKRCSDDGVLKLQRSLDSYLSTMPGTNVRSFFPSRYLRDHGLIRVFETGADTAFIRNAPELCRFLLPQYAPTDEDVRLKYEQVMAARGSTVDFSDTPISELVTLTDASTTDAMFNDPYLFSPVEVAKNTDLTNCTTSFLNSAMDKQYPLLATLRRRDTVRQRHASASDVPGLTRRVYRDIVRDVMMLLSAPKMTGVPPVYNDLYVASNQLLEVMRTTDVRKLKNEAPANKIARRFFRFVPKTEHYTGFAAMLSRLTGASRKNLGLIGPQSGIWMMLYLQSFSVSINRMGESFFGVLTGPPDTGKSRACEVFTDCLPPLLVMQSDGASSLAMTVYTCEQDMRVVYVDELKTIMDNKSNGNDTQTKLKQSQLSNGVIAWDRPCRNPVTGAFGLQRVVVVLRSLTAACTNYRDRLPEALDSRATKFAVASTVDTGKRAEFVSRKAQVAMRDMREFKLRYESWKLCMQTYSSLQWRYTVAEAVGLIPPMDDNLYVVFTQLLFHRFGESIMEGRQIRSLRRLAESIRIFDLITTWHTRGLGAKYQYDITTEIMFYASCSYLTAENLVAAYTLLEQTTSTDEILEALHGHIKDTVDMEDEEHPKMHDEYYVSRYYRKDRLLGQLCRVMKEQGAGMVKKMFAMAEAGLTSDGQPNIKIEKIDGQEYFLYHSEYMARVRTETEVAILRALQALYKANRRCGRLFEDEANFVVFDGSVMVSFYEVENPAHSLKHPDLARKTKAQIKTAMSYLRDATTDTGERMFQTTNPLANVAVYVPHGSDDMATATPSTFKSGEYKKRKEVFSPLVVHERLLRPVDVAISANDAFLVDYLAIAGGYEDSRRVYAGIDPKSGGPDSTPDHMVRVPPDHTVSVTVPNKLYRSKANTQMLGDFDMEAMMEETNAADAELQNFIYSPHERTLTFTEESGLELRIATRAVQRINPGPEYEPVFIDASHNY